MRRFEAIHGVVAMLLAGAVGSCAGTTRRVKTVPTASIQQTIDECVRTSGDKACTQLCVEVFGVSGDACGLDQHGKTSDVWYEAKTEDTPADEPGCAAGRRPAGLACPSPRAPAAVAAYFAWAAQMEAASVTAFARVYRTLLELGADLPLRERVRDAIADEIKHTQVMVALAHRHGVRPSAPVIEQVDASLVERAIENVVEGCVGETVAALHAALIATHAEDASVRAAFAQIAIDETRHALLSYDLAAVYMQHLAADDRARVVAEYARAVALPVYRAVPPALLALGVPDDGRLAATVDEVLAALAPRFACA